jgi:D-beta-D-heptose 7-phosphate kinase/D-beta-D-heptose 1-phosphate adenosyltransferase
MPVVALPELTAILAARRAGGARIVFTNGCFDLLHVGHLRYLVAARALGDLLVVGVNTDASVRGIKGEGRPVVPEQERSELLAALRPVDYVVLFDDPTPEALIRELRPEVLVKGGDWSVETIVGAGFVTSYGGSVTTIPVVPGRSTTSLLERISGRSRG